MGDGVDELSDVPADSAPARRVPPWGRTRRVAIGIALVLLAALLALWIERKPIAGRVIDSELGKRGVVARYAVEDLGFGRQRLTQVVIGDPAAPDLVADWLETRTHIGLNGANLDMVRAGHVRLRGRIVDGRLSLGEIDKLMPPASGKAFALPALGIDVQDARMRLETPQGVIGLRIAGRGRLDDGFSGTIAAVSDRMASGNCKALGLQAAMSVDVAAGQPHLTGPVRIAQGQCAGVTAARMAADLNIRLTAPLDGWRGTVRLSTGPVNGAGAGAGAAALRGTVAFEGDAAATSGTVDLRGDRLTARGVGQAAGGAVEGRYRIGMAQIFAGRLRLSNAQAAGRSIALADTQAGDATPIGPLRAAFGRALYRAAGKFDGVADVEARRDGAHGQMRVTAASVSAASGASIRLAGGSGLAFAWPDARWRIDTTMVTRGGGLPEAQVVLAQEGAEAAIRGRATVSPFAAGQAGQAARLALAPVVFTATPGGATRIVTRLSLSGPLGNGRIDGLTLPLDLRWDGRGTLLANPACTAVAIDRLTVSGLTLDPVRTTTCPLQRALVTIEGGSVSGGVRLPAIRLTGRLGQTPVTVTASGGEVRLADRGFVVSGVAARLGNPARLTRIDLAQLTGRIDGGAVAGTFSGGAGQIANVPLLLGGATGDWSLRGGALTLSAAMTVDDAADDPRFKTLSARDVAFDLTNGAITARGTLYEPTQGVKVADVSIAHQLASGRGKADLSVPGIAFTERFQPDLLTRLTFGVVADVRGSVTGEGHIGWSPDGVTSTGQFATKDANLAAAFGPVTGITTTLRFTDLLGLASAPGQVATIRTVNPGIAVNDGTIVYQLLPNLKVKVDHGTWPFAGGTMTLLPTTLDFTEAGARRMTFRLDGVAADQFLQQFDFKNLTATGVFDGELPMIFDVQGGRIENGHLTVRQGGGSLAYVGDLSQKDLGLWGNIAFQALKSLRYRNLTIGMNGPLAGEMITEVRFAGVTQGQGAKSNFLVRRLQRLPFVFNIRIKAPFRGLLDSAQSFYDPRRLIQRNLPALLDRQRKTGVPIQPPASGIVP